MHTSPANRRVEGDVPAVLAEQVGPQLACAQQQNAHAVLGWGCGHGPPCHSGPAGRTAQVVLLGLGQLVPEGKTAGQAPFVRRLFTLHKNRPSAGPWRLVASHGPLVHRFGHLEQAAGAVACGEQAGDGGSSCVRPTTIRLPSTSAPILRARAVLPATPRATNTPSRASSSPPASRRRSLCRPPRPGWPPPFRCVRRSQGGNWRSAARRR